VGPEVYRDLTGEEIRDAAPVDLRSIIAGQLRACGLREVTVSKWCTRCDNDRFFSHRCGDEGRQLGVIVTGTG
jgi:copper oxidase (laccase) domain-containing protein